MGCECGPTATLDFVVVQKVAMFNFLRRPKLPRLIGQQAPVISSIEITELPSTNYSRYFNSRIDISTLILLFNMAARLTIARQARLFGSSGVRQRAVMPRQYRSFSVSSSSMLNSHVLESKSYMLIIYANSMATSLHKRP
jgi:hypothetical protein